MKKLAIISLVMLTGCSAAVKLPGTKDPHTEQIKILAETLQKQADALVAVAGKATPTPTPTIEVKK